MAILSAINVSDSGTELSTFFSRGKKMTQQNKNSIFKISLDVASVIFVFVYPIYCILWAHYSTVPTKPLPIQLTLMIADVLPCALGIFWLLYRLYPVVNRHPRVKKLLGNPFIKIALFLLPAILVILAKSFWR